MLSTNPAITRVFELVGLDRISPVHRTFDDALAALAQAGVEAAPASSPGSAVGPEA